MHDPSPLPSTGEAFLDARGGGRALRVTWHPDAGVVVLSLWRDRTCAGTFRLPAEEVPALVEVLREGLDEAYDAARGSLVGGFAGQGMGGSAVG
ncbi:MAG TPA: hypothetical protein VFZ64_11950 [Nocardioidaceae bacterium]